MNNPAEYRNPVARPLSRCTWREVLVAWVLGVGATTVILLLL